MGKVKCRLSYFSNPRKIKFVMDKKLNIMENTFNFNFNHPNSSFNFSSSTPDSSNPFRLGENILENKMGNNPLLPESPVEVDGYLNQIGLPATLLNLHLAKEIDLGFLGITGIGIATFVPVQISGREGGRKSIFKLAPKEEILHGVFFSKGSLIRQVVTRTSGNGDRINLGDLMDFSWKNVHGQEIKRLKGEVVKLADDNQSGEFALNLNSYGGVALRGGSVTIACGLASCVFYINIEWD